MFVFVCSSPDDDSSGWCAYFRFAWSISINSVWWGAFPPKCLKYRNSSPLIVSALRWGIWSITWLNLSWKRDGTSTNVYAVCVCILCVRFEKRISKRNEARLWFHVNRSVCALVLRMCVCVLCECECVCVFMYECGSSSQSVSMSGFWGGGHQQHQHRRIASWKKRKKREKGTSVLVIKYLLIILFIRSICRSFISSSFSLSLSLSTIIASSLTTKRSPVSVEVEKERERESGGRGVTLCVCLFQSIQKSVWRYCDYCSHTAFCLSIQYDCMFLWHLQESGDNCSSCTPEVPVAFDHEHREPVCSWKDLEHLHRERIGRKDRQKSESQWKWWGKKVKREKRERE